MMALGKICVLFPNMLSWNKNSKIILFVLLPRRLWWHRWELVIGVACLLVNQWEMCQWKGKAVPTGRQIFILKSENRNHEGSPFSIFCFDHSLWCFIFLFLSIKHKIHPFFGFKLKNKRMTDTRIVNTGNVFLKFCLQQRTSSSQDPCAFYSVNNIIFFKCFKCT